MNTALCVSPSVLSQRHYAGRSLQIYRALDIRFRSLYSLVNLNHRLRDTAADTSEEVQGYVTELMLTLKMNAGLLADAYVQALEAKATEPPLSMEQARFEEIERKQRGEVIKLKTKSLQMGKMAGQVNKQQQPGMSRKSDEHGRTNVRDKFSPYIRENNR